MPARDSVPGAVREFFDALTEKERKFAASIATDNLGLLLRAAINELDWYSYNLARAEEPTFDQQEQFHLLRLGVTRLIKLALEGRPSFDVPTVLFRRDRSITIPVLEIAAVRALSSEQTLTYLHGTISSRHHRVSVPETPMYLDALLADTPLVGGLEPTLGGRHLRTLTLVGFPNVSRPGILDALNEADFAYRWVTRFIALDKTDATKLLTKLRRQWFNKRKSISALLREVLYNQPAQLLDSDADNKVADADLALQALGGDHVSFGYLTTTITVADEDRATVEAKIRQVERIVGGLGLPDAGAPGCSTARVRDPAMGRSTARASSRAASTRRCRPIS